MDIFFSKYVNNNQTNFIFFYNHILKTIFKFLGDVEKILKFHIKFFYNKGLVGAQAWVSVWCAGVTLS